MIEIGKRGLQEANLIIDQGCSESFTVIHKDDSGNVIDHSNSTGYIALQKGKNTYKFPNAVTCGASNIVVSLSGTDTKAIKPDEYLWDLIVVMQSGQSIRLLYGDAYVIDTYALD